MASGEEVYRGVVGRTVGRLGLAGRRRIELNFVVTSKRLSSDE